MDVIARERHASAFKSRAFRKVITLGKDDVWPMDLVDMGTWASENSGYVMLLTVIDCFTRYAWAVPVKRKDQKASWQAFLFVLQQSGRVPAKIWSDYGGEFYNETWKKQLKERGIDHYSTFTSQHKASVVERFNRTLKEMMWRCFTENGDHTWVSERKVNGRIEVGGLVFDLVDAYNHKIHSALTFVDGTGTKRKLSPAEASALSDADSARLWRAQYGEFAVPALARPKYAMGTVVRISRLKGEFEKGYTPRWSDEVYRIIGISSTYPVLYFLRGVDGTEMKGGFYQSELLATRESAAAYLSRANPAGALKPDSVVAILGYTVNPKSIAKFGKYDMRVRYLNGEEGVINLGLFVGHQIEVGKGSQRHLEFKSSAQKAEVVLAPFGDYLEKNLPNVWEMIG